MSAGGTWPSIHIAVDLSGMTKTPCLAGMPLVLLVADQERFWLRSVVTAKALFFPGYRFQAEQHRRLGVFNHVDRSVFSLAHAAKCGGGKARSTGQQSCVV